MRTVIGGIAVLTLCACPFFGQSKLSSEDRNFVKMAADLDMTEAHIGQMAQQQASGQDVKSFGQTLASDHSNSYGQLLAVAEKAHEQAPRGINIDKDAEYRQLQHATGAKFDRTFLADEIRGHERALAEFKREAEHGQNPELKTYAKEQIPVLEQHLRKAQDLARMKRS
jgi:putative membrane protein